MMTVPENNNYNEDSRNNNNNTDNNNELQGFHDLPKFLQFGLKYTASRYKKSYIAIQFLVQFGLIPIFGYMTKSLPFSIILSGYLFISNLAQMFAPDFTKGVFLDLLLKDAKITKRINDNMYKLCIGSMVTFLVIVPPFIFYYIAIPFATDPNQMLGPSTFVITLLMSIIGYIAMIPMFILTSCQTLIDQVSLVHISTIKTYLEKVRVIIMNNNNNVEEDGIPLVDKLSKEQEQVEKWIMDINNGISLCNTLQLCNYMGGSILFLVIADGGYGIGPTVGCAITSLFAWLMVGNALYAIAKPNMVWEQQKVLLLNDAKVILNLKFPKENFESWLLLHHINASKAFGTKITFEKMKQTAGVLTSLFGIALYLLLRDQLRNVWNMFG